MLQGYVFIDKNSQAVRLPEAVRFDGQVKKVSVRMNGKERIICPVENTWDSFFLAEPQVTEDFLSERAGQTEAVREAF